MVPSRPSDKSGTDPTAAVELCRFIRAECPHLKLAGVMTIGRYDHVHDVRDGPNPDFVVREKKN